MALPIKHSLAVIVRRGDNILAIRRPKDDDELPGIWGLPAGSFREGEDVRDLIQRIGREKLGVHLVPVRKLAEGTQTRRSYRLDMELWEVAMEGTPQRAEWKWSASEILESGRSQGSLCCDLGLKTRQL